MSCYVHIVIGGQRELYLITDLRKLLLPYPGGEWEGVAAYIDDDWDTQGRITGEDAILVLESRPEIVEYNKMMTWLYKGSVLCNFLFHTRVRTLT
jgi:hypothetical protein